MTRFLCYRMKDGRASGEQRHGDRMACAIHSERARRLLGGNAERACTRPADARRGVRAHPLGSAHTAWEPAVDPLSTAVTSPASRVGCGPQPSCASGLSYPCRRLSALHRHRAPALAFRRKRDHGESGFQLCSRAPARHCSGLGRASAARRRLGPVEADRSAPARRGCSRCGRWPTGRVLRPVRPGSGRGRSGHK